MRSMLLPATFALFAVAIPGQVRPDQPSAFRGAPLQPDPADAGRALPGSRPGTERWIVHLRERSFDLDVFRRAILERRDAREVDAIVADLEHRVRVDQAPFAAEVERLGGRMLAQWWIVNACAIEIAPARLEQLGRMAGVVRLEPDQLAYPGIRSATNALNHNADAVNARGILGIGVAVAIMDTGADEMMGSSGRPHRLYFVDGDPNNLTGGGIGGSRLVVNHQAGLLAPEDINSHGTLVAAITAGGQWGTTGADHGHARGAKIASYAIADQANSGASATSMVNGWQAIAAQRAARGIVAANNSYHGSSLNSAVGVVQQALDSTGYNADVLISVIAGNQGNGTWGQSGCNALVAAAVTADVHRVADWSGHGPLPSDPARLWPDIAAVGVDVVEPTIDCEGVNVKASGTSMAGPQVCGAAALLRAAFPALRADETKALLLASAMDIADRNPDPPHNTRNAYGMGLLRDDVVLDAAKHALQRRGWTTVQASNPRVTVPVTLTAGIEHGIAIAWHRKTFTHLSWSNLDLRVLDANNVEVAASMTPRNLYEMVRLRPAQTGVYTLEVTAASLDGTAQEFAYAVAESLAVSPVAARYDAFGLGCGGSGSSGAPSPICAGANPGATTLTMSAMGEGFEFALQETAPPAAPITVQGISILTTGPAGRSARLIVSVYAADGSGRPAGSPLASAPLDVGTATAWWGTTFAAPVTINAGARYFVAFATPFPSPLAPIPSGTSPETRALYSRSPCLSPAWSGPFTTPVAYRVHCAGSGGPAIAPTLWADGLPAPSATITVHLQHARPAAAAALLTGTSRTVWGSLALPFDLGVIGAANCRVLASGDVSHGLSTDTGGRGSVGFTLPGDPALLGSRFYQQFAVLDAVNALGLVTTNGGSARIGLLP